MQGYGERRVGILDDAQQLKDDGISALRARRKYLPREHRDLMGKAVLGVGYFVDSAFRNNFARQEFSALRVFRRSDLGERHTEGVPVAQPLFRST